MLESIINDTIMFLTLLILSILIVSISGSIVCDNPSGPNCSPFSSFNFLNQESVGINQPTPASTDVSGITYDVVIQWTHQVGEVIDFTWEVYSDNKKDRFDCSTSKMWFNGIEVGSTSYFRGKRNDEPYCVFDMRDGILTNAYLQNPSQTVFFLFDNLMDPGSLFFIDKNRDLPIIPSDNFNPNHFDSTMVCTDPNGAQCNPITSINFDTTTVEFDYMSSGITDVKNSGTFDVVIQWIPPLYSTIFSSWKVYPSRVNDPFVCDTSRLWLNGTVVTATNGFDGTIPYCIFNIHDGVVDQAYIDNPGRTVFFLFDNLIGLGDVVFISEDFSKPVIASEDYNPFTDDPSIVCDNPSQATCNVIDTVSFVDNVSNLLTFTSPGSTIVNGVNYDMVIKWIANPSATLDYTWHITPVGKTFDCSTTKIWINGTVFDTVSGLNGAGVDYCYFDIRDGVIPQAIVDDPTHKVFFLLGAPLVKAGGDFVLGVNYDFSVVSLENYDPINSNPNIVCDDASGPNCNVINTVSFINVGDAPVAIDYSSLGLTTVNAVDYDMVIKWNIGPDDTITHSWIIYPDRNQDLTTCDGVKMWFNGTVFGSTLYFRGTRNDEPYCVVDMQYGKLPQAVLDEPFNKVFFLIDGVTGAFNIVKDYSVPIVSRERIVFYLYDRIATTASTDVNTGTTFTVTVGNLTYPDFPEFTGSDGCNSLEELMTTIKIGDCAVDVQIADNTNGVYTYYLPKELYYMCSYESSEVRKNIDFLTRMTFPEGTPQCKYFNPDLSIQVVVISVTTNSMSGIIPTDSNAPTLTILNSTFELCDPALFPLPEVTTVIYVKVSFTSDLIEIWDVPYLDGIDNALDVTLETCVFDTETYCIFQLTSNVCRQVVPIQGGGCSVDRFFTNTIYNFNIKSIILGIGTALIHEFSPIPTPLGLYEFPQEVCDLYNEFESHNVNDQFVSIVKVRNRPSPDWLHDQAYISFYEPLMIEVSLEDGTNGTETDLEIVSVEIIVRDDDGELINKLVFNRGNKIELMGYSWSPYYKDVHFCADTCFRFYTNHTTPYVEEVIYPQLFDICQYAGDTSSKDYFSFFPHIWFEGLALPTLNIEIKTIAVIQVCSDNRRMLLNGVELYPQSHISTTSSLKMATPLNADSVPRVVVDYEVDDALSNTKNLTSIFFSVVIALSLITTISVYFVCKPSRTHVKIRDSNTVDF